jgi:hypothetical protein
VIQGRAKPASGQCKTNLHGQPVRRLRIATARRGQILE